MKGLFSLLLCFCMVVSANAQAKLSYTMGKSPNVSYTVKAPKVAPIKVDIPQGQTYNLDIKVPKTEQDCQKNSSTTTNSATYKGVNYPVYATTIR